MEDKEFRMGKYALKVASEGFTLWEDGKWIVDASLLVENNEVQIGDKKFKLIKKTIAEEIKKNDM